MSGLDGLRDRLRQRANKYGEKRFKRSLQSSHVVDLDEECSTSTVRPSSGDESPHVAGGWIEAKKRLSRPGPNSRAATPRTGEKETTTNTVSRSNIEQSLSPADARCRRNSEKIDEMVRGVSASNSEKIDEMVRGVSASNSEKIDEMVRGVSASNSTSSSRSRSQSLENRNKTAGTKEEPKATSISPAPRKPVTMAPVNELASEGIQMEQGKSIHELEITLKDLSMLQGIETSKIAMLARSSQKVCRHFST